MQHLLTSLRCAGEYPADASILNTSSSGGLMPWPVPGGSCLQQYSDRLETGGNLHQHKSMHSLEGQAVAIPKLRVTRAETKACLVIIQPAMQAPEPLQQLQQRLQSIIRVLRGGKGTAGVIDSCASPKEVKTLPIDLTAIAVCFAQCTLIRGIAIVPNYGSL